MSTATEPSIFVNVSQACDLLGVRRNTLYNLIHSGEICSVKIGARRLIARAEIERFAAAKMEEAV
jgi:excisionase family DNA binding protein